MIYMKVDMEVEMTKDVTDILYDVGWGFSRRADTTTWCPLDYTMAEVRYFCRMYEVSATLYTVEGSRVYRVDTRGQSTPISVRGDG